MGTINPHEAKQLREAFREVGDKVEKGFRPSKEQKGDYVEIVSPLTGGPKDPVLLVIKQNDKVLASIPITNGTLRRLKGEMVFFRKIKSGSAKAFRYGNRP